MTHPTVHLLSMSEAMRFRLLTCLALVVTGYPIRSWAAPANGIAAVVNNEIITIGEVQRRAVAELEAVRQRVSGPDRERQMKDVMRFWLEVLIQRRLLKQAAEKIIEGNPAAKKVLDKALAKEVKRMRKILSETESPDQEDPEAALSWEERTARVRDDKMVDIYLRSIVYSKVFVSPRELRDYYIKNRQHFSKRKRAKIRRIMFQYSRYKSADAAREQAEKVLKLAKSGQEFEALVRTYSDGPRAKPEDPTQAGLFSFDEVPSLKELRDKAMDMEEGQLSDVVAVDEGVVIFKAEEVRPAREMSFEEAQNEIREFLTAKQRDEATKEAIQDLESKALVKRLLYR